jgi:hypothetical protein
MAVLAVMASAGGIASDAISGKFWARHALLGRLVATVIVVMLSDPVINDTLGRRTHGDGASSPSTSCLSSDPTRA